MKVLALHGFLGQGSDWCEVQNQNWVTPSLFSPKCPINLSSLRACNSHLYSEFGNVDVAIGYSMGGRILLSNPEVWPRLVIIAAHTGLKNLSERELRARGDKVWAQKIHTTAWAQIVADWNNQGTLTNSSAFQRNETDFSKEKLSMAFEGLSLATQETDYSILFEARKRITWVVGDRDARYLEHYNNLKAEGVIEDLVVIKNAGHRVIMDNPRDLRAELVARDIL